MSEFDKYSQAKIKLHAKTIFAQECLAVRRKTSLPFVLDEIVDDMHSLLSLVRRKDDF
jgi:hypothetical protein